MNRERLRSSDFSVDVGLLRAWPPVEGKREQACTDRSDRKLHRGSEARVAEIAFTAEHYRSELVHLASRVLGSSEHADDIVQDALLEALVNLSECPVNLQAAAWLCKIISDIALQANRTRDEGIVDSAGAVSLEYTGKHRLLLVDPRMDVERHYELQEMRDLAFTILEGMSDARRQVLEMCVLEERPVPQVAAALKLSPSDVKVLAFRTKIALRRQISKLRQRRRERAVVSERCSQSQCGEGRSAPVSPCDRQKWSMGFIEAQLARGRRFQVLTLVDQHTRECLMLCTGAALSGEKIAAALDKIITSRGAPKSITVDRGTEFGSKAMHYCSHLNRIHPDLLRPGGPVENGYIETLNRSLRDECLNVDVFFSVAEVRRKLELWRRKYNNERPLVYSRSRRAARAG